MESLKVSRREFLKKSVLAVGILTVGSAVGCADSDDKKNTSTRIPTPSKETTTSRETMVLGDSLEISLTPFGIGWVPDGHTPFVTFPDGRRQFYLSGDSQSYVYTGQSLLDLQKYDTRAIEVAFGPDENVEHRNGYSAITSVLQTDTDNPNHLMALTHNERWIRPGDGSHFQATVGLLESVDGGKSWNDNGVLLSGRDILPPGNGERVSGVGQPCAIITSVNNESYVNIYYVEWMGHKKFSAPDQIYFTRCKVLPDGTLDTPEHLTPVGFQKNPDPATVLPALSPPSNIENSSYIALPSISFNTHLNKFLAVCETNVGFVMSTSENGLEWSESKLIANFPQPQSSRQPGDTWYSYPTLLSLDASSDQITNKSGLLVASKGQWQRTPHHMVVMPFELT